MTSRLLQAATLRGATADARDAHSTMGLRDAMGDSGNAATQPTISRGRAAADHLLVTDDPIAKRWERIVAERIAAI